MPLRFHRLAQTGQPLKAGRYERNAGAQRDVSGEPGYLMLLRGQTFSGYSSAKHGPLWNYRLLPGRAGDAGALLFHLIYDRTWSAYGCPEWARITLREFCEYTPHKGARAIRITLKFLVDIHLIERDSKDPWLFKAHPENIANAPLLMPVRHPNAAAKTRQARAASVSAPDLMAALQNGPKVHDPSLPQPVEGGPGPMGGLDPKTGLDDRPMEFGSSEPVLPDIDPPVELKQVSPCGEARISEPISASAEPQTDAGRVSREPAIGTTCTEKFVHAHHFGASLTDICEQNASQNCSFSGMKQVSPDNEMAKLKLVSFGLKPVAEIQQPVSAEGAVSVASDENYCPWNWHCPFLVSNLAGGKPLIQISQSLQVGRSAVLAEEDADRPATRDEVEQIRRLLLDELGDKLPGDIPSDDLCQRIHRALAGCPLECAKEGSRGVGLLRHRIRKRYWTIDSFGFAELLASDVGKYWQENRINVRLQQQELRSRTENLSIERVLYSFYKLHQNWQALKQLANVTV